jgi:capsular polysaccharide biosynthesis protein
VSYLAVDEPLGGPNSEALPAPRFTGQFVSLHYVVKALARRRKLWITLAAVGLIAGACLHLVIPPKYSAETTLLLNHNPADDPTKDMATDVALLESEAVAQQVINGLHLKGITAQKLTGQYSGTAVTDQVLTISVEAPTSTEAVQRANALAHDFLVFRSLIMTAESNNEVASLQDQIDGFQKQINTLTSEINGLGNPAPGSAVYATYENYNGQKTQDLNEIGTLQSAISSDQQNTDFVVGTSRVIATATAVTHSKLKTWIADGGSGLVAGLAIGLGIIIFMAIASDRIRQRGEFAAALGAPVELSVGKFRTIRVFRKRRLRRRLSHPGRPVELMAKHLRSVVLSGPNPKKLAVVSMETLDAAALSLAILAGRLAVFEGKRVMVIDLSPRRVLGELLGVASGETRIVFVKGAWVPVLVAVPSEDDPIVDLPRQDVEGASAQTWTSPEVVLVFDAIDPGIGAGHLGSAADEAVVVGTAGRSNAAQVRATSEMLRAAGLHMRSAILVGADRNDDSLGLVPVDQQARSVSEALDALMETSFASAAGVPEHG